MLNTNKPIADELQAYFDKETAQLNAECIRIMMQGYLFSDLADDRDERSAVFGAYLTLEKQYPLLD